LRVTEIGFDFDLVLESPSLGIGLLTIARPGHTRMAAVAELGFSVLWFQVHCLGLGLRYEDLEGLGLVVLGLGLSLNVLALTFCL